jgi:adenosylmethionine-8-amino-7-oxononanoate aminotransferase
MRDPNTSTSYPWQELTGARICAAARNHGLLTRPILDTIVLMPPLCITEKQIIQAVDAIALAISEVCLG